MRKLVFPEPLESSLGPRPETAMNVSGTIGTGCEVSLAMSKVCMATSWRSPTTPRGRSDAGGVVMACPVSVDQGRRSAMPGGKLVGAGSTRRADRRGRPTG